MYVDSDVVVAYVPPSAKYTVPVGSLPYGGLASVIIKVAYTKIGAFQFGLGLV